jgi:hypothetical protein
LLDHPVNFTVNGASPPVVLIYNLQSSPVIGVFR